MPNSLPDLIRSRIETGGPISVAAYMDLCLAHPEFGYYRRRDPLGTRGDFTTAPEISQLFGEMIGVWIADCWIKLGGPAKIYLGELGPGRGTLMADILRVLRKVPALADAVEVHMIETSDILKEKQADTLSAYPVEWHSALGSVPKDAPLIVVGNEFLDALSFRQAVKTKDGWRERMIEVSEGKFIFALGNILHGVDLPEAEEGEIFEFSPAREDIWREICERIGAQTGAALMIDYGHAETKKGNTFQAVKKHEFADVLEDAGQQDLTSHVDFAKLKQVAGDMTVAGPVPQMYFLKNLGIELRAEKLSEANPDKKDEIMAGYRRLTHRDEMGLLFKVMAVCHGMDMPAGFEE